MSFSDERSVEGKAASLVDSLERELSKYILKVDKLAQITKIV
jgi:hypothetical protein